MDNRSKIEKARGWAKDTEFDPKYVGEPKAAAVEIINKLPDEWIDAEEIRKYLADWRKGIPLDILDGYEEEMLDSLERLLPTPKPKTLADMTPEDRKACQWGQVTDDVGNRVVLTALDEESQSGKVLYENGEPFEWGYEILVPLPELPHMKWPGSEPETGDVSSEQKLLAEQIWSNFPGGESGDHVHWAKLVEDSSESVVVRDKDNDFWEKINGEWVEGGTSQIRQRRSKEGCGWEDLPFKYAPYTRGESQ